MKIAALCALLATLGCAAAAPPGGIGIDKGPDLSFGTGGVGGPDLLPPPDPQPGDDLSASPQDLAKPPEPGADLSVTTPPPPPPDMANPIVPPDLAKPIDMTQPIPPDMAKAVCTPTISGSTCNVFPQCGCAANQNCNVENTKTGAAQCEAVGTVGLWGSCDPNQTGANGDGVCVAGSSCVDGVCSPFCSVDADCGGAHRDCVAVDSVNSSTGVATPIPGFSICLSYCDPTNPQSSASGYTACGAGVNCFGNTDGSSYCMAPVTASGTQKVDCTGTGADIGDPTLCAAGYACIAGTFSATCYKQCHVSGGTECTGTQTCHSQPTKLYAGTVGTTTEIGYCK